MLEGEGFLLVGIFWIGHTLQADKELELKNKGLFHEEQGEDNSSFYPQYELPKDGKPICINERASRIASAGPHTLVLQLDDWDKLNSQ